MTEHYIVKWVKTREGKWDGMESYYNKSDVKAIIGALEEGEIIEVKR